MNETGLQPYEIRASQQEPGNSPLNKEGMSMNRFVIGILLLGMGIVYVWLWQSSVAQLSRMTLEGNALPGSMEELSAEYPQLGLTLRMQGFDPFDTEGISPDEAMAAARKFGIRYIAKASLHTKIGLGVSVLGALLLPAWSKRYKPAAEETTA